jgi:hypothetical protein
MLKCLLIGCYVGLATNKESTTEIGGKQQNPMVFGPQEK